jgi:hypothetical protein
VLFGAGKQLAINQMAGKAPRDAIVLLIFGQATSNGNEFGATIYSGQGKSTLLIAPLAEAFAAGYYNYLTSDGVNDTTAHALIVLATLNRGTHVTNDHGVAWAHMVNQVTDWINTQG